MSLLALFFYVDDFLLAYEQYLDQQRIGQPSGNRGPKPDLSLSEVMTIIIHFQQSNYHHFKAYYIEHVQVHLPSEFPSLVSHNRFIELMPDALLPLCAYLCTRLVMATAITFTDSIPLAVCHNRRLYRHKVFDGLAVRGKSSILMQSF